jgi:hypothetical protein
MKVCKKLLQYLTIIVVNAIVLIMMSFWMDGLKIQSILAAIGVYGAFITSQVIYWWVFINFFSFLPVWLYPTLTFVLAFGIFMILGNLIPGVLFASAEKCLLIACYLTLVNAILGSILSLDLESKFDSNVTRKLILRRGKPIKTNIPGFVYLEIDGLSRKVLNRALQEGHMPTLKNWLVKGSHQIVGWETDFTSQTCAMQSGILMGNNDEIPAYRWWDRKHRRVIVSGNYRDASEIEARESNGHGLLSNGGASRGNMFSGDAAESLFTFATLLAQKRGKGPEYYLYLVSPFIIARLIIRFITEVLRELWQAFRQKIRKDKYIINTRTPLYALFRAAVSAFLQDLTTYIVISDVLRGLPAVYAMYVGYDDIAHYAGMETPEAFGELEEIDRYFARIERALNSAPRPYHVIILSDHGQSVGPTFKAAYGITLEQLVKGAINGDPKVYASLETNEVWDQINAFLNESLHEETRTAHVMRTMLLSRTRNDMVEVKPERNKKKKRTEQLKIDEANVIVLASGCTGLIYFSHLDRRMTYEEIQNRYPDLIPTLIMHPGIGYMLVRSSENGDLVLGKEGIHFLDQDIIEGIDPLMIYSANASAHLKRESSFSNCPDIIVNTTYNPLTEELCSFENQVSHHGGLGGPQNYPFLFYPVNLPIANTPIVGATSVYRILKGWRESTQSVAQPPESVK